jgi:hypothetical protein
MVTGTSLAADASIDGYFLQVRTRSNSDGGNNYYWIDDVVVDIVPEPGSMSLLAAGAMLLMSRKRR